jgi:predicted transcriptional regulator
MCGSFTELLPMPNSNLPRPTYAELSILRVLWTRGSSTVREVHETLGGATGYTTVLKLMQIMAEKALVLRDESARTHVYQAAVPEAATQRQLVGDLMERAFAGSPGKLVLHALSGRKASPDELAEIRRLLDEIENERK